MRRTDSGLVVNAGTWASVAGLRGMIDQPPPFFVFEEADHLTRIHLKFALEDAGFAICEEDARIELIAPPAIPNL